MLLAALPVPLFLVFFWFITEVWPRTNDDLPEWLVSIVFGGLIGFFVLGPVSGSGSSPRWRLLALTAVPILAMLTWNWLDSNIDLDKIVFGYDLLPALLAQWLVSALAIAALTFVIAPLNPCARLWLFVSGTGLLTGLVLFVYFYYFFCWFGYACIEGFHWLIVPALLIFPMGLALSLHLGSSRPDSTG